MGPDGGARNGGAAEPCRLTSQTTNTMRAASIAIGSPSARRMKITSPVPSIPKTIGTDGFIGVRCRGSKHWISRHTLLKKSVRSVTGKRSTAQRREKLAQFGLHLLHSVHGSGNLQPKQFPVSLAQSVGCDSNRSFRQTQFQGELRVRNLGTTAFQGVLEVFKQPPLAVPLIVVPKPLQHTIQQCERPSSVEFRLGRDLGLGLSLESGFGRRSVKGHPLESPTPFERPGFIPFVGQEMVQGSEQKRPESSSRRIGISQPAFFQQTLEEGLREILSILRADASSSDVGEQRVPIILAQGRKGFGTLGRGRVAATGSQRFSAGDQRRWRRYTNPMTTRGVAAAIVCTFGWPAGTEPGKACHDLNAVRAINMLPRLIEATPGALTVLDFPAPVASDGLLLG